MGYNTEFTMNKTCLIKQKKSNYYLKVTRKQHGGFLVLFTNDIKQAYQVNDKEGAKDLARRLNDSFGFDRLYPVERLCKPFASTISKVLKYKIIEQFALWLK